MRLRTKRERLTKTGFITRESILVFDSDCDRSFRFAFVPRRNGRHDRSWFGDWAIPLCRCRPARYSCRWSRGVFGVTIRTFHLRFFTLEDFRELLQRMGFGILKWSFRYAGVCGYEDRPMKRYYKFFKKLPRRVQRYLTNRHPMMFSHEFAALAERPSNIKCLEDGPCPGSS
jgi:hypothetical protein